MGVFGAATWTVRCASSIPVVLIENATLILIVLVLGTGLIFTRYTIIMFAPAIGDNAVFWTGVLDGTLDILELFVIILKINIEVIIAAFEILAGKAPHIDKPQFTPFNLNATEFAAITHEISYSCRDYDTLAMIIGTITRRGLSPFVCPLVRYTYPLRTIFPVLATAAGWLTYDASPWPFGGKDLSEPGNCEYSDEGYDVMCAAIGAGFVIIEVVLPIFIFVILATTGIWSAIISLLFECITAAIMVSYKAVQSTLLYVRSTTTTLLRLLPH